MATILNIAEGTQSDLSMQDPLRSGLEGKVALVIGGTRGVGAHIAIALARAGAHIATTYASSEAKAKGCVERFEKAQGHKAIALKHDPGNARLAGPLINEVLKTFGRLDILVHASSVALHGKTIDDPTINNASMDLQWQVNVHGYIALVRAAAPHLRPGGRIIALSSGMARRVGIAGAADYAGTKAAVLGYTKGVARDLASRRITANVILAGMLRLETPNVAKGIVREEEPSAEVQSDDALRIEEVVQGVLYLTCSGADSVNGTALDLTGGCLA